MMDVQLLIKGSLGNPAMLANMPVPYSCPASLAFPVRPVIELSTTTPGRIFLANHPSPVRFVETFLRAIIVLADSVLLPLKRISTYLANKLNPCVRNSNDTFCSLPCATAFSGTKVMLSQCAGRFLKAATTPITEDINFVFGAPCRAIDSLNSPYSPERSVKLFAACRACFMDPLRFVSWHKHIISSPCLRVNGSGSEMIGASLAGWEEVVGIEMEEEYVRIARARLAYWAARTEQLGFDL